MYAQLVETGVKQVKSADQLEGAEQAFQRRIDDGVRIEAKDWMPDAYRKTLVRQISQHAHSEIVGMLPEGNWITRALAQAQGHPAGQGQDEAGHGLYLQRRRDAGRVARRPDRRSAQRPRQVLQHLQLPTLSWADIGMIGWLVDGSAIINQIPLCRCSYARAMVRVCKSPSTSARATTC